MNQKNIRNFCIISHIDHGKSTLADRMLEKTGTVAADKIKPQMLDTMDLERERGITIKLQPVTMRYKDYALNLIDTPGHVDFSYEVSRSLAAVEGAVLLVDASKGIQAQTLANLHIAQTHNLKIIPVINKIDLPGARVEESKKELSDLLNIDESEILTCSAKTGEGVAEILDAIIKDVPAPTGEEGSRLKALIFDSVFNDFRGAIAYVRVFEGELRGADKIKFLGTGKIEAASEVGEFKLKYSPKNVLRAGEIGYIVTGAKDISEIKVGDTISTDSPESVSPIPGFKIPTPFVYASFYTQGDDPAILRKALEKLALNDSSLSFTPESSQSFGQGFRCGFLGLLHMEIVKERLEREYNLDLIITQPQVAYEIDSSGTHVLYKEPWVNLEIITPNQYLGPVMGLVQSRRAIYKDTKYLGDSHGRVILAYEAPLGEIIVDFYDKLKSVSQGYASQNYEMIGYRESDLVKLDVIIAGDKVSEFSRIVPHSRAQAEAKKLALMFKELIPKQLFEVSIQVAVGGKILAREDISALRKDVIAKLYGGDRTRKDKLLKKQAKGKKKMKQLGRVEIPDNVFMEILKR
ncbi:MAG: translation elongation factor 4 [Patescibacteria group bacterium]|jgi:GTP-binding protein LepA